MSFNLCSISGTIPNNPVISTKNGLIFDKALIEKYIEEYGKCPITDLELNKEDLIQIKCNNLTKPLGTSSTSLPGLFKDLQSSFEDTLIESHNLKEELQSLKNELTYVLYQYDASCRVISRLIKERDDAREQLERYKEEFDVLEEDKEDN